ncbi:hypothetical protein DR772_20395 [Salmonella enterica]|nr:hypothetical protein [Salmonella enterica]
MPKIRNAKFNKFLSIKSPISQTISNFNAMMRNLNDCQVDNRHSFLHDLFKPSKLMKNHEKKNALKVFTRPYVAITS